MSKATHKGTCQCCGSLQKLPGGKLSLHGYEVIRIFRGTCMGSRHLPFEQSKDLIESAIAYALERRESISRNIGEAEAESRMASAGGRQCWYHVYHSELSSRTKGAVYLWHRVTLIDGAEGTESRPFVKAYQIEGQEPERIGGHSDFPFFIRENNGYYVKEMREELKKVDKYVEWQRQRIKDWAPKELSPIDADQETELGAAAQEANRPRG